MKVFTSYNHGAQINLVEVQASFAPGFSGVEIFGSTSPRTFEAWRRSKALLDATSFALKAKKVLINLVGESAKEAPGRSVELSLDGAFVLRILMLGQNLHASHERGSCLVLFDFDLEGKVLESTWSVAMAFHGLCKTKHLVLVGQNTYLQLSALLAESNPELLSRLIAFSALSEFLLWVQKGSVPQPASVSKTVALSEHAPHQGAKKTLTFADMTLNANLAEAAMVSAVGRHHMLLRGPPGLGKTMFAKRLVSILPPLSVNATLGRISVPGCVAKDANLMRPVLRCPHHSASVTAMTGSIKSPGEMSLAHHGILLMDELPEFRRDIIESLREPMESGVAHVSRAAGQVSWPAEFQWIATANNCPCGWLFSQRKRCTCSSQKIQRYMAKLSGPLLDRVCMHIVFEELPEGSKQTSLSVKEMREKVAAACKLMQAQPLAHWQKQEEALAPKLQKEFLSKRSLKRFFSVARSVAALRGQTILAEQDLNRARTWTLKAASKKLGFEDSY